MSSECSAAAAAASAASAVSAASVAHAASAAAAAASLSEEKRRAFAMRDFLTPAGAADTPQGPGRPGPGDLDDIEYIDGVPEAEVEAEPEPACRLRRWRPVSRRLRCPRLADNLCGEGEGEAGCTDLADRLRSLAAGGISASVGELMSLAPPLATVAGAAGPGATVPSSPTSPNYLTVPSLAQQSATDYFGSSPECCLESPAPPPGPRYKLAAEGALQVCCFQRTPTVITKILSAKFLRRWETHVLVLAEDHIASKTASNAYTRDQWYHSIVWRRNMIKYKHIICRMARREVVLKELKNMVDYVMTTPLHDESVACMPLQLVTDLLLEEEDTSWTEQVVSACAPLLAECGAGGELCAVLARLCRKRSRAAPLPVALAPPVRRVLKRNVDFARAPQARRLVLDYISALSNHDSGSALVRRFVEVTHGPRGASCPHPRAAPNLVAVALAAINDHYREPSGVACEPAADSPAEGTPPAAAPDVRPCEDHEDSLCFADILLYMSEYPDWLVIVGGVLQPVPLSARALRCPHTATRLAGVLRALAPDPRCAAHACLAPARTARATPPSWLRVASPADPILNLPHDQLCQLWGDMLGSLLGCCFRRKSFLRDLSKQLPDFLLVALTEHPAALEALCLMLEWNVTTGEQTRLEIISTLQGTQLGQKHYRDLCERQQHLQKLQAVGGPRRLALPVKATDEDVARLLAAGSFGNLECLSLAFTSVTSACAYHLIKLPTLRYLNLWATQFGDAGVQLIAEHLPKLQVLNLCETPISDKGIEALAALSSLRRLNLNSTNLSAEAFADLKQRLPQLQEFDVRYTEAW